MYLVCMYIYFDIGTKYLNYAVLKSDTSKIGDAHMLVLFDRGKNLTLSTKIMYIGPSFLMLMNDRCGDLLP